MKILRKHNGFTTNSSSASEWLIPGKPVTDVPENAFGPDGNLKSNATLEASAVSVTETNSAPTDKNSLAADNTAMILGFAGAILGIFAIERFVRRMLKKKRASEDA